MASDVDVTARFAGNELYRSSTRTERVEAGSEETITLELSMVGVSPSPTPTIPSSWWIMVGVAVVGAGLVSYLMAKKGDS